jgi:hypothetical protein
MFTLSIWYFLLNLSSSKNKKDFENSCDQQVVSLINEIFDDLKQFQFEYVYKRIEIYHAIANYIFF